MPELTETEAIVATALASAKPNTLEPGEYHALVIPEGGKLAEVDLTERFAAHPMRKTGTVNLHTGASLATYVKEHEETDATRIYADVYTRRIVGVVDGHAIGEGNPGWGQHRAVLEMRHTPEWKRWATKDGLLLGQVDFAEHVEESLDDIREPDGATLLELAKTFEAKTDIAFRSAVVLESGQRQLNYVQNIDARAGVTGDIVIPKELTLGLAPFEGSDQYKVTARLRYRITNGVLGIGYQLIRAEDVMRAAFTDTLAAVEEATGLTAFRGVPA